MNTKQLWIGTVEVRPLKEKSEILGESSGAFVNIVTWACDSDEYSRNVELVIGHLGGLFISEIINQEPIETRRARISGKFSDDIEDMISRAQDNPNAIIYGTFHMFEKDDA
jgi:hypothetical protein